MEYSRVILKLSGESFCQDGERGISMEAVTHIAKQTYQAAQQGVQIAIVIGGGNILRGAQFTAGNTTIQEATAHYMGMLATVINGLALQDALESLGCETRLLTAVRMDGVAEPYIRRRARRHLEKGRVIILAAGTGSPFVTTDTAAAQRALELGADALLKATRVDGIYSDDPEKILMLFFIGSSVMRWSAIRICELWTRLQLPNAWNMVCPSSCSTTTKKGLLNARFAES